MLRSLNVSSQMNDAASIEKDSRA